MGNHTLLLFGHSLLTVRGEDQETNYQPINQCTKQTNKQVLLPNMVDPEYTHISTSTF